MGKDLTKPMLIVFIAVGVIMLAVATYYIDHRIDCSYFASNAYKAADIPARCISYFNEGKK